MERSSAWPVVHGFICDPVRNDGTILGVGLKADLFGGKNDFSYLLNDNTLSQNYLDDNGVYYEYQYREPIRFRE